MLLLHLPLSKPSAACSHPNRISLMPLLGLFRQKPGCVLLKITTVLITLIIMVLFYLAPAEAAQGFYFSTFERLFLPDFERVENSKLDLFVDENNRLYIMKADQIYIFTNQGSFTQKHPEPENFYQTVNIGSHTLFAKFILNLPPEISAKNASFWVNTGHIYLKPSEDHSVWIFDLQGGLVNKIQLKVPKNSYLLFTDIAVDQRGYIYLLESSSFQIEVFDMEGNFCGTFTKSGNRDNQLPGSPKSIFIDKEGSVYCLVSIASDKSQIVKYSYQGRKIETFPKNPEHHYVNIYVDQNQNTFAVDPEASLVEKFDRRGHKICQFQARCISGLTVDQQGLVYLDSGKNFIVNLMRPAILIQLIDRGNVALLDESWGMAEKLFLKAQVLDNQVDYIHLALGELYYRQHQWIKAMNEFKFIKDNWRYSQALTQFRNNLLINDWPLIAVGLLIVCMFLPRFISLLKCSSVLRYVSFARIVWQPIATIKAQTQAMKPLTAGILILTFAIIHYFSRFLSNPIFTGERQLFSWWIFERSLLITLALVFIWSLTAYKVGELFQGLAKYTELLNGTAICLFPLIIAEPTLALLSHLLTFDELWIYQWLYGLLFGWIIVLFINKIRVTEAFDWTKTIGVGVVNLAATALFLVFLGFMFAINQQLGNFLNDISKEIYNRFTT